MRIELSDALAGSWPDRLRFLVVYGRSGTGKSTLLGKLTGEAGPLGGCAVHVLRPYRHGWGNIPADAEWVAVDEVKRAADIVQCARLLAAGRRLLVASHVRPAAFRLLRFWGAGGVIDLDGEIEHMARYLEEEGVVFSRPALEQFARRYGGSITEVKIVLNFGGRENFDRAFHLFSKQCSIRIE